MAEKDILHNEQMITLWNSFDFKIVSFSVLSHFIKSILFLRNSMVSSQEKKVSDRVQINQVFSSTEIS